MIFFPQSLSPYVSMSSTEFLLTLQYTAGWKQYIHSFCNRNTSVKVLTDHPTITTTTTKIHFPMSRLKIKMDGWTLSAKRGSTAPYLHQLHLPLTHLYLGWVSARGLLHRAGPEVQRTCKQPSAISLTECLGNQREASYSQNDRKDLFPQSGQGHSSLVCVSLWDQQQFPCPTQGGPLGCAIDGQTLLALQQLQLLSHHPVGMILSKWTPRWAVKRSLQTWPNSVWIPAGCLREDQL